MQVFITGGSGFLGTAILPYLVKDTEVSHVHVLIRSTSRQSAAERIDDIVHKVFAPEERSLALSKLAPAIGDLTLPNMGFSSEALEDFARRCTHILHVGASTDFGAPLDESRQINVDGTQKVLDFAMFAKELNPKFVRLDYVSTAFVAGTKPGTVDESTLSRGQRFANNYEQSKYEAELLVKSYSDRLPIAIERPSIVVGDSRNGFTPHFKVLYWPLLLLSKNILPFIPCNPMASLDIVPVDFVAKGIFALMKYPFAIGETFHLTAGPQKNVRLHDFLNDAFKLTTIQRRPMVPLWFFKTLRSRVMRPMMSESFWEACELAAVYSDYIRGTQVKFNNVKTNNLLKKLGVVVAPSWSDYRDKVFDYCMQTRWGKRKKMEEYLYRNPETGAYA